MTEPVMLPGRTAADRRRARKLHSAGVLLASAILSFLAVVGVMQVWTQFERTGRARPAPTESKPPG